MKSNSGLVDEARAAAGLQISIRKSGDVTILDLQGRVTIGVNSELLSSRIKELLDNRVRKLLLNLTDLTQVDSSGIKVLITTYDSLRSQRGELKFLCPCGHVLEVLRVLRLPEFIPTFDDESEALASIQPQQPYVTRP